MLINLEVVSTGSCSKITAKNVGRVCIYQLQVESSNSSNSNSSNKSSNNNTNQQLYPDFKQQTLHK